MRYSPRNIEIAFSHAGLTHYGGILFFNEFSRMLQLRRFLTRHLRYPRPNQDYQLSPMILSLAYPIIRTRPVTPFRSVPRESHGLSSVTSVYVMDCGILIRRD